MEVIEIGNKNYCLLIGKVKLDIEHISIITRLKNCKVENIVFNETDNLWYYKNYKSVQKIIDILYPNNKKCDFEFLNNNIHDYRQRNIKFNVKNKYNEEFPEPTNYIILDYGNPYKINGGRYNGQYRNMYWKVRDENNQVYYIMHIKNDIYTKISLDDIDKVINVDDTRPCWYLQQHGYITSTCTSTNKIYYLHQLIMNVHKENLNSYERTVDHINRDKLDNRNSNLRIVSMSVQNTNRDKQERRTDAIELPDGITQQDLPKYVVYRKEILDKESGKFREYFYICGHPNCERWETSKSNKYSNYEKLLMAIKKLKELNNEESSDLESDTESEPKIKLPKYISYTKFRDQPCLIFDKRTDDKRYNLKMIVKPDNFEFELNYFIDKINKKYPELNMKKPNSIYSNEELINDELVVEPQSEILAQPINIINEDSNDKIVLTSFEGLKLNLPQNFTFYGEKGKYYYQYAKVIKGNRITKKYMIKSNDLQKELNDLIDILNKTHTELQLSYYTIPNLPIIRVFNDIIIDENIDKPKMPNNFSITTVNKIDYIQFCKKIDGERIQYKTKINSYNLHSELYNFIDHLNNTYSLKLDKKDYIIPNHSWKTTNKIIDHNNITEQHWATPNVLERKVKLSSEQQLRNRESVQKYLAKKKEELGEDEVRRMKTEYMKTYRNNNN
jgi:hypothetical protein